MSQTQVIKSLDELDVLAKEIADHLQGGDVLALSGDLGAGKTAFTQSLAKALGVKLTVTSPTFILLRQYPTTKDFTLYHSDWYRLEKSEVDGIGVVELFGQPDSVVVIEWPERARDLLPPQTQWMDFDYVDGQTRRITVNARGSRQINS